jgi:hypothetical protein
LQSVVAIVRLDHSVGIARNATQQQKQQPFDEVVRLARAISLRIRLFVEELVLDRLSCETCSGGINDLDLCSVGNGSGWLDDKRAVAHRV